MVVVLRIISGKGVGILHIQCIVILQHYSHGEWKIGFQQWVVGEFDKIVHPVKTIGAVGIAVFIYAKQRTRYRAMKSIWTNVLCIPVQGVMDN